MARQPVTLIGVSLVKKNMLKLRERLLADFARELTNVADKIVTRAKDEFVPVKTGALRGTIKREKGAGLSRSAKTILIPVIAGGASTISPTGRVDYANRVHEEHPTGAKFIEKPALEEAQRLPVLFKRAFSRIQRL